MGNKDEYKNVTSTEFIKLINEAIDKSNENDDSTVVIDGNYNVTNRGKMAYEINLLEGFCSYKPIVFVGIRFGMIKVIFAELLDRNNITSIEFQDCYFEDVLFKTIKSSVKIIFSKNTELPRIRCERNSIIKSKLLFDGITIGIDPSKGEPPIPYDFNFNKIVFDQIRFSNCTFFTTPNFSETNLCNSSDGAFNLEFFRCNFNIAPSFLGVKLNHQTVFSSCNFNDISPNTIAKYRYLRSEMNRLGNEREALIFGSLELEANHLYEFQGDKISGSDIVEKLASYLYLGFSSYGRDVLNPLLLIVLTLICFCMIYLFGDLLQVNEESIKIAPEWIRNSLISDNQYAVYQWGALSESFINSLGPLGFFIENNHMQSSNIVGEFFILLQRTSSSIMWFLWILQIRRRFKLS